MTSRSKGPKTHNNGSTEGHQNVHNWRKLCLKAACTHSGFMVRVDVACEAQSLTLLTRECLDYCDSPDVLCGYISNLPYRHCCLACCCLDCCGIAIDHSSENGNNDNSQQGETSTENNHDDNDA